MDQKQDKVEKELNAWREKHQNNYFVEFCKKEKKQQDDKRGIL
jgi:hypothetical protein